MDSGILSGLNDCRERTVHMHILGLTVEQSGCNRAIEHTPHASCVRARCRVSVHFTSAVRFRRLGLSLSWTNLYFLKLY